MSAPLMTPLQGMTDIAAPEVFLWQHVEETARRVFDRYGFTEVRTPVLERLDLFARSLGEQTDVVRKEMYAFEDRGGRRVALRPEGTAGIIRHLAGLGADGADARVYYLGPMFRAERPQAGRKRQFHQIGAEAVGSPSPAADAECVALQVHLLEELGLSGFEVSLNTRGSEGDLAVVEAGLREALEPHRGDLCADCMRRLEQNVFRVLDCKQEVCRARVRGLAPITSFMGDEARAYAADVRRLLHRLGVPAVDSPWLVRGLDYYVHTIWEITHSALGAQDAVAGGGRYRIDMGGRSVEGVGFAMGVERLILALEGGGVQAEDPHASRRIRIVSAGEAAREENLALAQTLRQRGIRCALDLSGRSVKAQMRQAHRLGARCVIVRGDAELSRGVFLLKDMADGSQVELALPELIERLLDTP